MAYTERYVRADAAGGGDGTTDANSGANGAWTLAEAVAITTDGLRRNIKSGVGTYTLSGNVTLPNGASEAPDLWQGFVTTPGDLEDLGRTSATGPLDTTGFPTIDCTASYGITMGSHNTLRNLVITGSRASSSGLLASGGVAAAVNQIVISNTGSGGANNTLAMLSHYGSATDCDFIVASTASTLVAVQVGRGTVSGCRLWHTGTPHASSRGYDMVNFGSVVERSIVYNIGIAFYLGDNSSNISHNSIYNCTDGVVLANTASLVYANVFGTVAGYLFKGATTSGNPQLILNASTTPTSGRIDTTGAGTIITEINDIALSGSPFTDASTGDFTLNNTAGGGADCRAASLYWGGFADLGAVQHQDAGGGGGGGPLISGRLVL